MTPPTSPDKRNAGRRETDNIAVRAPEAGQGLVVTRIGKSYRQRPVVRSVSLTLQRGEVVGLLGQIGRAHV